MCSDITLWPQLETTLHESLITDGRNQGRGQPLVVSAGCVFSVERLVLTQKKNVAGDQWTPCPPPAYVRRPLERRHVPCARHWQRRG